MENSEVQLIKEEIERRVESMNSCPFKTAELDSEKFDNGELYAYKQILQFIEQLQDKHKCIYNRTIEERIESCKYCSAFCTERIEYKPASDDLEEDSSFEKLLQEIYVKYEKQISIKKLLDIATYFVEWQRQKDQEEPVSEDLEEASWNYSNRDGIGYGQRYAMQIDFKAGARWQKKKMLGEKMIQQTYKPELNEASRLAQQEGIFIGKYLMKKEMMKNLVEGEIVKDIHNQLKVTSEPLNDTFRDAKFGDKVKIIIVKDQQ